MNKFAGLETLNKTVSDDANAVAIYELNDVVEMLEVSAEFDETIAQFNTEMNEFDEMFASFKELEHLHTVISEHGISKSMMLAADSDGYLTTNLGLPAAENLNADPINDADAQAACEALSDTMKKFWDGVKKFFAWVMDTLKAMATKVVQFFTSYEKILVKMEASFKDFKFDADKAKDKKVKILSKPDLDGLMGKIMSAQGTVLKALAGIDTEDKLKAALESVKPDLLRLGYKPNDKGTGLATDLSMWETKEGSLTELKWDDRAVTSMMPMAKKLSKDIQSVKSAQDLAKKAASAAEAAMKASNEKEADIKAKVAVMKSVASLCVKISNAGLAKAKTGLGQFVAAGNAVLSCRMGKAPKEEKK